MSPLAGPFACQTSVIAGLLYDTSLRQPRQVKTCHGRPSKELENSHDLGGRGGSGVCRLGRKKTKQHDDERAPGRGVHESERVMALATVIATGRCCAYPAPASPVVITPHQTFKSQQSRHRHRCGIMICGMATVEG
eukprot:3750803-Rhodomonas_salina.6